MSWLSPACHEEAEVDSGDRRMTARASLIQKNTFTSLSIVQFVHTPQKIVGHATRRTYVYRYA